jgi:hypothetical protein
MFKRLTSNKSSSRVPYLNKYPHGSIKDREILSKLSTKEKFDFLYLQVRNIWRVDGLYFLKIEEMFGTEAATKIDTEIWKTMAIIEAKSLHRMFNAKETKDIQTIMRLLLMSSWALDQPFKKTEIGDKNAVLSVVRCRTQETRLKKGLHEFPCKQVRLGYLQNFVETINPNAKARCMVCPPDKHSSNIWCKWEITI